MIPHGPEITLRAVGAALAGLSLAFAVYMLCCGGDRIRINGVEHLAIFAQPREGLGVAAKAPVLPALDDQKWPDMTATGSVDPRGQRSGAPRAVDVVGARADRLLVRIHGVIRTAFPGDDVPELGRIAAIVQRGDAWAVVGVKGETLLTIPNRSNGSPLFDRKRIFD